jgi:hypothetical protein
MLHARSLPSPTYTNPSSPSESFEHANDTAERDGGVFVGEGRGVGFGVWIYIAGERFGVQVQEWRQGTVASSVKVSEIVSKAFPHPLLTMLVATPDMANSSFVESSIVCL